MNHRVREISNILYEGNRRVFEIFKIMYELSTTIPARE